MQDKNQHNIKGHKHGYWKVKWFPTGGYECHYINGLEYGFDDIDWGYGDKEKLYYAR